MFRKLFKPDYSNEINIYSFVTEYINNLKSLLNTWINQNKYRNNKDFNNLFSLLLDIEIEINSLEHRNDPNLRNKITEAYQKLDLCLNKIKNKILKLCESNYDDAEMLLISAELIKLRNIVARNINISAIKKVSVKLNMPNYLKAGDNYIYDNILLLEKSIYIRKSEIQGNEMRYR